MTHAVLGPGVQNHERPVRRLADLHPDLFGHADKGDTMLNSTKGKKERVGRMMMMHSNNREEIDEAFAGDIIALAGLKDTTTGDTLCDPTIRWFWKP